MAKLETRGYGLTSVIITSNKKPSFDLSNIDSSVDKTGFYFAED